MYMELVEIKDTVSCCLAGIYSDVVNQDNESELNYLMTKALEEIEHAGTIEEVHNIKYKYEFELKHVDNTLGCRKNLVKRRIIDAVNEVLTVINSGELLKIITDGVVDIDSCLTIDELEKVETSLIAKIKEYKVCNLYRR